MHALPRTALHHEVLTHVAWRLRPLRYLEVGVRDGDSLTAVCKGAGLSLTTIVLCDTWGAEHGGTNRGTPDHIWALLKRLATEGLIAPTTQLICSMDSAVLLPALSMFPPFDVVHIDGDHSEAGAYRDLTHGWRLCGSAMVVHDAKFGTVARALARFQAEQTIRHREVYDGDHGTEVLFV